MCSSLSALINCTFTRTRLPIRRTLPSKSVATPSVLPISRALRVPLPRYDITEVREMTFRSLILDRQDGDRLVDLVRGRPWQQEKSGDCRDDHAGGAKYD